MVVGWQLLGEYSRRAQALQVTTIPSDRDGLWLKLFAQSIPFMQKQSACSEDLLYTNGNAGKVRRHTPIHNTMLQTTSRRGGSRANTEINETHLQHFISNFFSFVNDPH